MRGLFEIRRRGQEGKQPGGHPRAGGDRWSVIPEKDLARWYRKYAPDIGTLAELEAYARDAKLGLWSQPNSIPPWEWRRTKGEAPPNKLTGEFIGNRRSRVYHRPGCPNAAAVAPGSRVPFDSAKAAEAAGFGV